MAIKYLLDTNVISEFMKPQPNERVVRRFEEHQTQVVTASTVWHELIFGNERLPPSKRRRVIEEYLQDFIEPIVEILPYDEAAGRWHAIERARLSKIGKTPQFADSQIAAVAAVHNLTVVTLNLKDFENFEGLRVESWAE